MKSFVLLCLGSFISLTVAQLAGLPSCATNCALDGISSSGCAATNATCLCESAAYISSFDACITKSCDAADAQTAAQWGLKYCASAGVTLSVPSSTAAPSTTVVSTSAPVTSAPATTAVTSTTVTAAPVSTFTGAAALVGYSWVLLGVGGAVALGL